METMSLTHPFASVMAFKIHWLRQASKDIDAIFQFYSQYASQQVAQRRISKIVRCIDSLEKMPYLGRIDEEFTRGLCYRYLVVTYKVYYFVEGDGVYIASVWDCRKGRYI